VGGLDGWNCSLLLDCFLERDKTVSIHVLDPTYFDYRWDGEVMRGLLV
jgi:hypothetical protein